MQTFFKTIFFLIWTVLVVSSCVKREWDEPPIVSIPVGQILTIQDLKDTFNGVPIRFDDDFSLFAVVTADDRSGNLFRNFYIQDHTGAIALRTQFSGGLIEGDSVRVALRGITLTQFNGMLQLDSVNVDRSVIKQATGKFIEPQTVTMQQALNDTDLLAKLIKIEDVEFATSELGQTFANAPQLQTLNRNLTDCDGNTIVVRTSGFANFASTVVPSGNGGIIAILSTFNTTRQLHIRRVSDLTMTGERCTGGPVTCDAVQSVSENFESVSNNADVNIACWGNIATVGGRVWRGTENTTTGNRSVQANSFQSNEANEAWLISPPVQANGTNTLSFESQTSFWTHSGLAVLISTNYQGSNPNSATWTPISATLAGQSSGSSWIQSGTIPLFGFMPQGYTGNFHIAFRYNGNANAGETGTFRIDNVAIN